MGKGSWIGGRRIRVICPMLSSLAYKTFKGMGSGGSYSEVYLAYGLWWLFWLFG